MPHDKNGNKIKVGDTVILTCKVTAIAETEDQCNVTADVVRAEGKVEHYAPLGLAFNAGHCDLLGVAVEGIHPSALPTDAEGAE